jgi:secreted Zn-dependent insulinase-like peptidase
MLPKLNKYISLGNKIISEIDTIPTRNNIGYLFRTSQFENPNINVSLKIYLPTTIINKYEYTQTLIYFASIMLNVGHEKYMCETAGYYFDIMFDMGKLHVEIQGNYKKILDVCDFLVESLLNPQFSKDEFERTIYSFSQNDTNLSFEAPYTRVANYFNKTALLKFYTNLDRLKCYNKLTYDRTKQLSNTVFNLGTFDLLVSGNCDKKLYTQIANVLKKIKPRIEYKTTNILDEFALNIKKTMFISNIPKENQNEKNNSVGTYLCIANVNNIRVDLRYICMLEVLQKFISQEYFYQLRTQEKFGYIVGSGIILITNNKLGCLYFRFIVQSPNKTPDEMMKRTTKFINDFSKNIVKIKKREFDEVVKACIKIQEEPATNLNDLADEKMLELQYGLDSFNLKSLMINCYKTLTMDDIKKFYFDKFYSNNKLFVHV